MPGWTSLLFSARFLLGNSGLALAAGGQNDLPRQPTGLVGGQEHCGRCDVRGLPDAAEGRHGNHLLLVVTANSNHAGRASAFGVQRAGMAHIATTVFGPYFLYEHAWSPASAPSGGTISRRL